MTPLDNEEALDLTVSSSRLAEKNSKLKKSSDPQFSRPNNTNESQRNTNLRNPVPELKKHPSTLNPHDLMDSEVIGSPIPSRFEDKSSLMMQITKEAILEKVRTI